VRAVEVGTALEQRGYLISHRSGYLEARNWIQFCLMSNPPREALSAVVAHLCELTASSSYQAMATA